MQREALRPLLWFHVLILCDGLQTGLVFSHTNVSGSSYPVDPISHDAMAVKRQPDETSNQTSAAETIIAEASSETPVGYMPGGAHWHVKPRDAFPPDQVVIPPWWRRTTHFVGGAHNRAEWIMFFIIVAAFVSDHWILQSHQVSSSLAAGAWILLGFAGVLADWAFGSPQLAENFLAGWLFQVLGGLEDLFIFHVIMEAFSADFYERYVAMIWVSVAQMIFQFLLMVELDFIILSIGWLPYLLGTWLVLAGFSALVSSDEHSCIGLAEGLLVRVLRLLCGRHFSETFEEGACITGRRGYVTISMLLPMVAYCVATDFFFEFDTTLTKIEAYGNRGGFADYVSSMVAAAAIPHFYFVAFKLFVRFPLMKYAIACLLLVFGVGLLLKEVVSISPAFEASVLVGVVGTCIVYSLCTGNVLPSPEAATAKTENLEEAQREPVVPKNTKAVGG
mmetsp:Transcript_35826/g.82238  ORF Transcript_35826/g.82238 Transcript_35826/m.82238 type:complete len:448 (+) Transcript_35826:75-1418(+)